MGRKEPDYVGFQFYDGKKKNYSIKLPKLLLGSLQKKNTSTKENPGSRAGADPGDTGQR